MDDIPNTEQELVKFHAYLREKGLMNERTAYSRIQAAQAVLSVLDTGEKRDLGKLDRELAFRRFTNKNGQRFTPDSLETYQAYLQDPSGYRPSAISRDRPSGTQVRTSQSLRPRQNENPPQSVDQTGRAGDLLSYPLPLPSGEVARLLLPPVITTIDAQRITTLVSAMVNALAVEKQPT